MTDAGYFDKLYASSDDPCDLASSPYEQRKLALLMDCLPHQRYAHAFEPGCAIGVTTSALSRRCDRVTAMDAAAAAVRLARERLHGRHNVAVLDGHVPADWPDGAFDLIVLSELLYYLDEASRRGVAERSIETLLPCGDLVAVHWRHPFTEAHATGDEVHAELTQH